MSRVLELVCHPDTPVTAVHRVWVELACSGDAVALRYFVDEPGALLLAPPSFSGRAADLWQATCFELFVRVEGREAYSEYNFAPSTQWAAYAFDGYREGMKDLPCPHAPLVERGQERGEAWVVRADVDLSDIPAGLLHLGLSVVIEEKDGAKSYWALAHPPGKPDFHHPACFALELPAPSGA